MTLVRLKCLAATNCCVRQENLTWLRPLLSSVVGIKRKDWTGNANWCVSSCLSWLQVHTQCLSKSISTRRAVDGTRCASRLLLHSSFANKPASAGFTSPFTDQLLTNVNLTNLLLHRDPDLSAVTEPAKRYNEIKLLAHTLCSCSHSRPCPSDSIRCECGSCFISYAESRSELQPPWHLYGSSLHGHHLLLTFLHLLLSPMTPDPFWKQKESLWPTVWWSFISLCQRFTPFALFFFSAMAAPAPLVLMEKRRGCGREEGQEWLGQ